MLSRQEMKLNSYTRLGISPIELSSPKESSCPVEEVEPLPIDYSVPFDPLPSLEFSTEDCEAIRDLEVALKSGKYPKEPINMGKYIIKDFLKCAQRHLDFVYDHIHEKVLGKKPEQEHKPALKKELKGIRELVAVLD